MSWPTCPTDGSRYMRMVAAHIQLARESVGMPLSVSAEIVQAAHTINTSTIGMITGTFFMPFAVANGAEVLLLCMLPAHEFFGGDAVFVRWNYRLLRCHSIIWSPASNSWICADWEQLQSFFAGSRGWDDKLFAFTPNILLLSVWMIF